MNYFSYFSEVEERFQRRRGSGLLLSTLDWALIETWREAGIPLPAVLRGIDDAFDKRDAHPGRRRQRAINGLAWCSQAVVQAAEQMAEAAVGVDAGAASPETKQDGFEPVRVAAYMRACAAQVRASGVGALAESAARLDDLSAATEGGTLRLEELETRLTMLEEKMFAVLLAGSADEDLVRIREHSSRELAPYRSKMQAAQLRGVEQQFLHKRLLEAHNLPRLSLFYMPHA